MTNENVDPTTGEMMEQGLDLLENASLALSHWEWTQRQRQAQEQLGRIEMEIRRRLRESGGRTLPVDGYTISQRPEIIWDDSILMALPELVSRAEWHNMYTPETTKPVPAKINKTQVNKTLKNHGENSEVGEAILRARHEEVGKITVERL